MTEALATPSSQPQPAGTHLADSGSSRARVGLSDPKQVTRRTLARTPQLTRINRMQRLVLAGADEMSSAHQRARRRHRVAMITTTYRPEVRWEPRQISTLLQRIRDWLARRRHPLRAVWVLELQRRGAPHYHVLIWLPRGVELPKPDDQGWWPHGSTRIEWARRAAAYLSKYTSKGRLDCQRLPHGARVYGIYGCPVHLGYWRAPRWLQALSAPRERITYAPGGWWCVHDQATAWRSPWRVVQIGAYAIEIEWVGWRARDVRSLWEIEMDQRLARESTS